MKLPSCPLRAEALFRTLGVQLKLKNFIILLIFIGVGATALFAPNVALRIVLRLSPRSKSDYPAWAVHPRTMRFFGAIYVLLVALIMAGVLK